MNAVKQALLETSNKNLEKDTYPQKVIKIAEGILQKDTSKFSSEKLTQFSNFIGQGVKVKKESKLNNQELEVITQAASNSVNQFINNFQQNTEKVKTIDIETPNILDKITKNLEDQKYIVSD